ncbi:transposase [Bacillus sp. JJ722]
MVSQISIGYRLKVKQLQCLHIGEIGDLRRFENHKQLNAYAGINYIVQ